MYVQVKERVYGMITPTWDMLPTRTLEMWPVTAITNTWMMWRLSKILGYIKLNLDCSRMFINYTLNCLILNNYKLCRLCTLHCETVNVNAADCVHYIVRL